MKHLFQLCEGKKKLVVDILILFGLMVLFFSRWIFVEPYSLFASDIVQDFVTHRFASFSWKQGVIPLWDPYFFWAAVGYFNSGFFYPFNLLVDFLQIFTYSNLNHSFLLMEANIFFHFFLASLFMYFLVRQFVTTRLIAIIAGVTFAYSGYMVKTYLHYNYVLSSPWLPLFFLFLYRSIFDRRGWFKSAIFTGIVFAISLLPGQTQPAIYFLFLLLVFSSYAAYHFWQTNEVKWWKPFLSSAVILLITFGLFAIQFFPTYEYKKFTPRDSIEYSYSVGYSVDPLYFLIHSFVPSFWGTMQSGFWDGVSMETLSPNDQPKWLDRFFGGLPNEMTFYLGLLPFFMLPFALFTRNKFLRNFLFILLFFSILLMLARNMPLVGRLYWMVLGGVARVPARAAILWSFSLSFLAALGLQAIIDLKGRQKEYFDKIVKSYFYVFGFLVLIFFPLLLSLLLSQAGKPTMVFFFFPMLNGFSLFLIYFLIYSFLILAFVKLQEDRLLLVLIFLFTVVDVFSFHTGNTYLLGREPERLLGSSGVSDVGYLKKDSEYFRVHGMKMAAYANNLYSLGYGTTGSYGFAYRPSTDLFNIIPNSTSAIYDLLNVKYFYSEDGRLDDFKSSASSSPTEDNSFAHNAFDGDPKTEWIPDISTAQGQAWLEVTFSKPSTIAAIEFTRGKDSGNSLRVKMSSDKGDLRELLLQKHEERKAMTIKPMTTQRLRLLFKFGGESQVFALGEITFFDLAGNQVSIGSPTLERVSQNLFLNKDYFPRAFAVYKYRVFGNKEEIFRTMLADKTGEEMRNTVFLEKRPVGFANPSTLVEEGTLVKIKNYATQEVMVEAQMKADGFLVLTDVWYPGWVAFVDGKKAPILKAYYAFRAVQVPKGNHEIVFAFQPQSFKLGFVITSLMVFLLAAYLFYCIMSLKFRK